MNHNQHMKALADRFMKEGAEDLWNEKDWPIVEPSRSVRPDGRTRLITAPPLDLRKLISKGRDLAGSSETFFHDSDFDSNCESVQSFSNENSSFGRIVRRLGDGTDVNVTSFGDNESMILCD
ncbi:DEAD-box ATP-dependent RNA helicase 48 [Pyrus ussuriensis x Pyrus communis]|uniref:DEAD-box ATP-dependent RNA helicase 48 n=1 Tax=Pyrus ussuriensis x Pyrus communis TaxID=2448454 RepID=A0A5N5FZK7_9ROSA|nr:DEAD-box ATP-dependent RNA helicase 48 [Pyrus ussuriensis x Pyrus communis]